MRRFLKSLIVIIGIILLIRLAGFSYIEVKGIPTYEIAKIEYKAEITPQTVERGKKIVLTLCANCHKNHQTGVLSGHQMMDAPKEFGKVYSANITRDNEYGIGTWTDAELLYLLRTGIKRDGKYAPPWMAKLPKMADEDINSIIAFLRSDDPLVAASHTVDMPCEPSFLAKFLANVAFKPLPMPDHKIEMPDTNNAAEFGKYLVFNLECYSFHSADFKSNDYLNPEKSVGYLAGGNKPLNMDGKEIVTQNLTPDQETGIGSWTEERFINALKYGTMENQPALRYPMLPYVHLTDREAKAIYSNLRTVSSLKNNVPRSPFD